MREDMNCILQLERLEVLRREAHTFHLTRQGVNLWARLLPPLRRLEGWLERHSGSEAARPMAASRG